MSDAMMMIEESRREGARLVIGLAGQSGDGKTYTSLLLAYGLANGDAGKVGLLDTENKRGGLYSDILPGKARFRRGDLYAPFSPSRYIDAIKAFQAAGVEVLVVDSVTHEWEGPGGCEEIAESAGGKVANWKLAKKEHKRFVNALLLCDMHVICCLRAREKTSFRNPSKPESLGVQPICEKNFMFEMTASLMLGEKGENQDILKCPAELLSILGRGKGYLGIEDGRALRAWVDGAGSDPLEPVRNRLRLAASEGCDELKAQWTGITEGDRKRLGAQFLGVLKAQAVAVDELRQAEGAGDSIRQEPGSYRMALAKLCGAGNPYGATEEKFCKWAGIELISDLDESQCREAVQGWAVNAEAIAGVQG